MTQALQVFGGLGVFLLGIIVMTGGLRQLAGDALRRGLTRFTRSPTSGALTGAVSTAVLQSSSATTVAAVGFVGAGLLTFPQALGIVLGASLGTTVTGWLVAVLGFKLNLGTLLLPLIPGGVMLNLFGKGRMAAAGYALAGFGLIFVGLDAMRDGMAGLSGTLMSASLPGDTLTGRIKLVLLGLVVTLITQSSSAGVAAALTAVHTGAIGFEQAAVLVIGMNVGTSVTAVMATIGASLAARRTGLSHVIFNLLASAGALLLLGPYMDLWYWLAPGQLDTQPEIALVAFHSGFNLIALLAVLPFTTPFARLVAGLLPASGASPVSRLDDRLLSDPIVALETVRSVLRESFAGLLEYCRLLLHRPHDANPHSLADIDNSLDATQSYLDHLHLTPEQPQAWQFLLACIHALDHMQRLAVRLGERERIRTCATAGLLLPYAQRLEEALAHIEEQITAQDEAAAAVTAAGPASEQLAGAQDLRERIMASVAAGGEGAGRGTDLLEAARWLERATQHIGRIAHHLDLAGRAARNELEAGQPARREPPLPA